VRRRFFALFVALAVAAGLDTAVRAQRALPSNAFLTPSASQDQALAHGVEREVVRSRSTAIRLEALRASSLLDLPLFPDARFTAALDRLEDLGPGRYVWSGHLAGIEDGEVTFAVTDGVLAGQIQLPGGVYRLHGGSDGAYAIEQVDTSALPRELPPIVPVIDPADAAIGPETAQDDGSQIDLMVVYTPAARAAAGGVAAINALIDLSVSNSNTAYANSGVTQRLRLVHRVEVAYTENTSDMGLDLSRLRSTSDGYVDEVHTLRNTYGADFVTLLTTGTDACGIGYVMQNVSTNFAPNAFNVTAWNCAGANLSMAHELGHNMGLAHDAANAGSAGAYAYAYGYQDPGNFRTIMAYPCSGSNCPRITYFSTPLRTYNGRPVGVAGSANNALALNNTAPTTANFRASVGPVNCTYSIAPSSGQSVAAAASSRTVALTASDPSCAWTAVSNAGYLSITSASSGAGSATVAWSVTLNPGTAARSGTLTIAGSIFTVSQVGARTRGDFDGDGRADRTVYSPGTGMWATENGATRQLGLPGDMPVPGDYNGDGLIDTAVYRPSTGDWFVQGQPPFNWGRAGDVPVPADYNGDGITDAAVFRTSDGAAGVFLVRGQFVQPWGLRGDIPLAADVDGDGKADLAVFRPSTGQWFVTFSAFNYTTTATYTWGAGGDVPLLGDFDGDGKADLVAFRPATGEWFLAFSGVAPAYSTNARYVWGIPGDVPLALDMDGDRVDELVVYRRADATWWTFNRITGAVNGTQYGAMGDLAVFERPQFHTPATADFDGDHRADITVFRPSTGEWYTRVSSTGYSTSSLLQWGLNGDAKVPGDYDGDGKTDVAVYRPSTRIWYLRFSSTGFATSLAVQWGIPGDVPVPADYDGDGRTDIAVYRHSSGQWFLRLSSSNYATSRVEQFGISSDIAVPADYDGDGRADLAVYRRGLWFVKLSSGAFGGVIVKRFGLSDDVPVPGDWDGDGRADLGVFRPATGVWLGTDALTTIQYNDRVWGESGDVPLTQDFDGDGVMDSAVYHPSTGQWFVKLSSTLTGILSIQWGLSNDLPLYRIGGSIGLGDF
jgi:Metallo-peptidase family M12B Reprolysin-like/FG-GAP-like repeat